ncbi:undecaprenyl/decaprenyl-phosphate alpha-N-acetylglucosaminyl 1-phosphate transferase [bacterium]|nr:undecaprenyl/decaprenyl-phosphate alpha-N-acetylglucosaminyl 1-phosphate transferase [bacterium]
MLLIVLSFCISYLLTPVVCEIAWRFGIVDRPNERKVHKDDTPLLGGVAIYLAFSTGAIAMMWYSYELKGVVYAATLIFLLGLIDDIVGLSSIVRLIVQLFAVIILFFHGLEIDFAPDLTRFHILDKILTLLWVIGLTNAVNFLDGIDGLCAGFGAIAAFFFGLLAFLTKQYFLMFLAFSLTGSCMGFLPWNLRPRRSAKIFMGDAGSVFIGFTLASFAIMGDWAENRFVALAVPVLILSLPIFDISMTTYFRIREGSVKTVRQWLDYAAKDHFHHRLHDLRINKSSAVYIMYAVNIILGFSAIIVRTGGTLEAYLALIQAFVVLGAFTAFMILIKKMFNESCFFADDETGNRTEKKQ